MVKAGTKQVIRAEKWVAEYRGWVGSGLTQRSYCGQVGLIFTQFKSGVEFVSDPRTPYSRWPPIDRKISLKR